MASSRHNQRIDVEGERVLAVLVAEPPGLGLAAQPVHQDAFPEQLLRNVGGYLADDHVITRSATWEQLYALTDGDQTLTKLRDYLADKSVNLRPAFTL
jgi:hypothetical protein